MYTPYPALFSVGGAGIHGNEQVLTASLLALEAVAPPRIRLPLTSTLHLPTLEWERYLAVHPDQRFAAFIRRGLSTGFRIGADPSAPLRTPPGNFPSVRANSAQVSKYIRGEVELGRLQEVKADARPLMRCNPIGLIPKQSQPGKFRLIVDLSSPRGASVNQAIPAELCSLRYTSVPEAVSKILPYGRGALLAKLDLQSAYRHVPVHPADQHLLGIHWLGSTFADRALPFGLSSAPILFSAVADTLAWAMICEGIPNLLHYLDDFLFWGPPESPDIAHQLQLAVRLCDRLGLPAAPAKVEGPATTLTFLGITIDTVRMELRLPPSKLLKLRQRLAWFSTRRNATVRQVQSLVGLLNHASTVIPQGRIFTRHLIDVTRRQTERVRITAGCREDIAWWALLAPNWNGISFIPGQTRPPSVTVTSDASGTWGCGAYVDASPLWFQLDWPVAWSGVNIAVKELVPIVASAAVWGKQWSGCHVRFRSDNMAVVLVLASNSTKDSDLSHLLSCLFFLEAAFNFEHSARHVKGVDNEAADAISRNRANRFRSLHPQASPSPTPISHSLRQLLTDRFLTWTSPNWGILFANILQEASPRRQ